VSLVALPDTDLLEWLGEDLWSETLDQRSGLARTREYVAQNSRPQRVGSLH
jgi:hypothetical protein